MELSKLISLLIAALYVAVLIFSFVVGAERNDLPESNLFEGAIGILGWLGLSLGCIWWGDELGEGLIGAKFGLVSAPSPGWAVKMMGWIFLVLPAFIAIFIWIRGH